MDILKPIIEMFQYPYNQQWVKDLETKINEAETEQEKQMYREQLESRMLSNWWM